MTNAVAILEHIEAGELAPWQQKARDYAKASRAASTIRGYRSDWGHFAEWCVERRLTSLPAEANTIALYLSEMAETLKVGSLQRRVSAIAGAHEAVNLESPTRTSAVRAVFAGIRRVKGVAQLQKAPVLTQDLRKMVSALPIGLLGVRDRALLLLGFAGAFRRSELVALDATDLTFTSEGLTVLIRRSKTDQEGAGRKVGIPYGSNLETCPIRSVRTWLDATGITDGPIFRSVNRHGNLQAARLSDKAVAIVVKRCTRAVGLDSEKYSGHSLRAGLVTSAAVAGVSERLIMRQTGHKSFNVLLRYVRDASLFRENAAARVGL